MFLVSKNLTLRLCKIFPRRATSRTPSAPAHPPLFCSVLNWNQPASVCPSPLALSRRLSPPRAPPAHPLPTILTHSASNTQHPLTFLSVLRVLFRGTCHGSVHIHPLLLYNLPLTSAPGPDHSSSAPLCVSASPKPRVSLSDCAAPCILRLLPLLTCPMPWPSAPHAPHPPCTVGKRRSQSQLPSPFRAFRASSPALCSSAFVSSFLSLPFRLFGLDTRRALYLFALFSPPLSAHPSAYTRPPF